MKKIILPFLFINLFIYSVPSFAQSPCVNSLLEANKSYEAGDFRRSVSLLKPCLISGFSHDEKFEGYRLLALNYIYLNQEGKADTAVRNMLIKKHSYKLFPNISDPAGLTRLINTYDVIPELTVGINLGINFTNINLISNKSAANTGAEYIPLSGYQFGIEADCRVWKDLHISLGIQSYGVRYQHNLDSVAGWSQQYTENLTYVNVPVSARYYIYFKHDAILRPYVEAGAAFSFLTADNANILSTDNSNGSTSLGSLDPTSRRNKINTSILFGGGINLKLGNGWITTNVRYLIGQSLIDNPANRYNNLDFIFGQNYIDDDFKFNNWQFTVGYALPILYNVEKMK